MKLFERTGGYWIFYISAAYFIIGIATIFNGSEIIWLSPLYVLFLAMPFWFPPLGRAINLDVTWDQNMFDWFKKKDNVITLPVANVKPPEPEKPANIFYRLGLTDNNRVSFQMGYTEITMNYDGVQQMIDQLAFFQSQLSDEDDPEDDPSGNALVPEQQKEAA